MHLYEAPLRAYQTAQGIVHPMQGHYYPCAVLIFEIVAVFRTNGLPTPVVDGISPPPPPEVWSSLVFQPISTTSIIPYFRLAYPPSTVVIAVIAHDIAAAAPGGAYKPSGQAARLIAYPSAARRQRPLYGGNKREEDCDHQAA